MKNSYGDLWTFDAEYRVITTNCIGNSKGCLVMGKGIALQAKDKFPNIDYDWGRLTLQNLCSVFVDEERKLIAFPTKYHWRENSSLELIDKNIDQLIKLVNKHCINSVVMTRPGCGNGNLKWEDVEPLCKRLDDRFTVLVS